MADVQSGVVRLDVLTCGGSGHGSGALVAPDLVLTAAHVVSDAYTVTLAGPAGPVPGDIVSWDPWTEIALVHTDEPIAGHVFDVGAQDPPVGSPVAAIGFPLDGSLSVTDGIVSAVGVEIPWDGGVVSDQILFTAPTNRGNSGGPLVTEDGTLVGVVSSLDFDVGLGERAEGRANAIAARVAQRAIDALPPDPAPLGIFGCSGDAPQVIVTVEPDDSRAQELAATLESHGNGINRGEYEAAFALLSPPLQTRVGDLETWSSGVASSFWLDLVAHAAGGTDAAPSLDVTLTTAQTEPDSGEHTCTVRAMTYTFVPAATASEGGDPGWLIDRAQEHSVSECPGE